MQAAQDGDRDDASPALGVLLQRRCPLGDRLPDALMRAGLIEVRHVLAERAAQVALPQEQQMIEALAPHAAQEALADRVGAAPGRAS